MTTMLEINEVIKDITSNNLTYINYLRYYKLALLLNDKSFYELLSGAYPKDLDDNTEERFYELEASLKMKLSRCY